MITYELSLALEEDIELPFSFISGRVHELRLNIPWTALTSKPITLTLNSLEFVIGPKQKTPSTQMGY